MSFIIELGGELKETKEAKALFYLLHLSWQYIELMQLLCWEHLVP